MCFQREASPVYSHALESPTFASFPICCLWLHSHSIFIRTSTVDQNKLCIELGYSSSLPESKNGEPIDYEAFLLFTHSGSIILGFFRSKKVMASSGLCSCPFLCLIWSLPYFPMAHSGLSHSLSLILLPYFIFLHSTYHSLNLP